MKTASAPRVLAFCRFSIVFVLLLIGAGNITNNVLLKYGFRDNQPLQQYEQSYGLVGMMNGTAPRPYVYRSTLPRLAKLAVEQLPINTQQKLFKSIVRFDSLHNAYFNGVPAKYWTPVVALTYHVVYLVVVIATILTLMIVYKLARMHGHTFGMAVGFVAAFCFIYPLTFQKGGYFYDFPEILGVFGSVYLFLSQRLFLCTLCIALFSFSKETFFLVPLALYFLYDQDVPMRKRLSWLVLQFACSAASRHAIMSGYDANPGSFVEVHFLENIKYWINPKSYLTFYNLIAKGVFEPSLQNPLILVPLVIFFRRSWKESSPRYRRYFLAAFIPVFGLFMFFGYEDEARDFALVFPAIMLIALGGAPYFNEIFCGRARAMGIASPTDSAVKSTSNEGASA